MSIFYDISIFFSLKTISDLSEKKPDKITQIQDLYDLGHIFCYILIHKNEKILKSGNFE